MWRFVFVLFCNPVFADTVIFIGGYGSTSGNMSCWKKGAERQADYAGYKFKTIKYPGGVTGYKGAVTDKNSASQIDEIVSYINSHPDEKIVIAAHSSGSAIAFRAAEQIKNPKNVDYVNLSGWGIPSEMYRLHKVTAISQPSSYGNCPQQPRWCRHFSLVNKTPPADLNLGNLSDGYQGCNTNLSWLPKKGAAVAQAAESGPRSPLPQVKPPAVVKAPKASAPPPASVVGNSGSFDDDDAPQGKK